jgi:hypothetical protein
MACTRARTGQGHQRADKRDVGQQVIADDAFFQLGLFVRKDRHVGDFRAGARGGRDGNQRRAFAPDLINAKQLGQRPLVVGEGGDALGDVDGTAAAHTNQAIVTALSVGPGAVLDDRDFWLGFDLIKQAVTTTAQLRQR